MKKVMALLLVLVMLPVTLLFSGCGKYDVTLNVYNWGEYFSVGADGSMNVNAEFEKWYFENYGKRVKVNYDTYESNESLRGKLEGGGVNYDVLFPSDYMIEYFIEKDLLVKLNYDNIPLFAENIEDGFRNPFYDPKNEYTVPYAYGMVGIIYDANKVDAADATGWELLWNPKYSGKILQYNNPRDAFGTAMYKLGINVNTTDRAEWDRAFNELVAQKPVLLDKVMDEIFNMMESGEATVGSYYAGDYFTMRDEQADGIDLQFYYPERTNLYVDAMCIPKCSKNQEVAERYINFLLTEAPAIANAETTYYASPNKAVYNNEEYKANLEDAYDVLYPKNFSFAEEYAKYAYRNLDSATLAYMTSLWENLNIK